MSIGTFTETAGYGELIVLVVKGNTAENALKIAGKERLAGKTIIDTTNPIALSQPADDVLSFFTSLEESLMERLQKLLPSAMFVKAFNCVGSAFLNELLIQ